MYKLAQGPSKFNVQKRRGLQQPFDDGEIDRSMINPQTSPRPSFSSAVISGRRRDHHSSRAHSDPGLSVDHYGRDHYELVKMLNEQWEVTQKELHDFRQGRKGAICVEEFVDKEENPSLRHFKPFDWDSLCITRMMPINDRET
ncbi:mapk-regulated corepressor-interacting protein 1-like [Diadema setosum]|uniref:mapk-regulated corepressor-interacting protein 1-like n=1 Tax=Diadema antillarum TaxID=105358 RepID=UPI003A85D0DD